MNETLKLDIPFELNRAALLSLLHCTEDAELFQRALSLYQETRALFRPLYLAREFSVQRRLPQGAMIGGRLFSSRILSAKLQDSQRVLVYIASCGCAISQKCREATDPLDHYLLDQLAYLAYLRAMEEMAREMEPLFGIKKYRLLCPGSIIDWSVADVRLFFSLMDGLYQRAGLRCLDSGLIDPLKSTSGIVYETEEDFESCALCPRARCESRRLPFDPEQHEAMCAL